MAQRRSRKDDEQSPIVATIVNSGDLSLDLSNKVKASSKEGNQEMVPFSLDDKYRVDRMAAKKKHWIESPFAAGLVEIHWRDEDSRGSCGGLISQNIDPESSGCLECSGWFCHRIGAGRVGNMAVLHQTQEWVEELEEDEETGEQRTKRHTRPKLVWLMGPYWPMLLCVTYPLIFGVSLWTLVTSIPRVPLILQVIWLIMTLGLIFALAMTAFRDPGILYKFSELPPNADASWRWCDAAQSYRPRNAFYDPDCGVIVEDFDHT